MSKYGPLRDHLASSDEPLLRLTFSDVERILGQALPASARKHQAWWANEEVGSHSHARAWLDAGYRTQRLDLNAQTIEFSRSRSRSR